MKTPTTSAESSPACLPPAQPIQRIVFGYDGSNGADDALVELGIAGLPEALDICVLSVAEPAGLLRGGEREIVARNSNRVSDQKTTWASLRLAEHASAALAGSAPSWKIMPLAQDGPAVPILIAAALAQQADLVVLGAHGRSNCRELPLGGCTRRMLLHTPCSLRIARSRPGQDRDNLRILILVDLHDRLRTDAVVAAVAVRQLPVGTEVQLVAIVDENKCHSRPFPAAGMHDWQRRHSAEADARACALLEEYWGVLRQAGCNVQTILFQGDTAPTLVRYATDWEADCVFIALPPRSGACITQTTDHAFVIAAWAPCSVEAVAWQGSNKQAESVGRADMAKVAAESD